MKKVLITIFLLTFFLSFSYTNAQMQTPIDGVTISSYPSNPEPGDKVTISVESYLINLDSSSIVWISNGKTLSFGTGVKEVIVNAPTNGKKLIVDIVIKSNIGREIKKSITIKSGAVDIIWEALNYTPPFYKGKSPFVYQNQIRLIAMPHLFDSNSKEINPKNLVYQWKLGGGNIDGASGYGKQSVIINAGDIPKPLEISLEVYNKDQTTNAKKNINIEPTDPSVTFYEMNPLYGILLNKALVDRTTLNNSEITILASPFGFNFINNPLTYLWSINNVEQSDLSKNQSITLKTKGDVDGSSNIDLDIRNLKNILQGARSSLNINFKKKDTTNNISTF